MCGLVGIVGTPTSKGMDAFVASLVLDWVRGPHSTGVCAVHERRGPYTFKEVGHPFHILTSKTFNRKVFQNPYSFPVLMGHNRWATQGAKTKRNAHPFTHGHITLMHNGTLNKHIDAGQPAEFDTDSESIAYAISKEGIAEVWRRLEGAACLAWWDDKDKTFNLIRNSQRPMWIATTKDSNAMFYASEPWIMEIAAKKNRIPLDDATELKAHTHLSITVNLRTNRFTVDTEVLQCYIPPFVMGRQSGATSGGSRGATGGSGTTGGTSVVPLFPEYEEEEQNPLTEEEFNSQYQDCCFCGASLKNEFDVATIIDDDNAACEQCSTVAEMNNIDMSMARKGT